MTTSTSDLPLVVRERLVGLGHLVRLFLAADRAAGVVHRVDELTCQALGHRLARTLARGLNEPTHRERATPIGADLHRDLIRRPTDAARLDLDQRTGVLQRQLEDLVARLARGRLGERQRTVEDALRGRALPAVHELVVELLDLQVAVLGVRQLLPLLGPRTAWHLGGLLLRIRILRAVERAAALAVLHPGGVERAADDVVLHRGKVGDRAAAHEDDRVLLEVVADARDVRRHFHSVRETDAGDLPEGRVRLLWGHGADDRADTALLRRATLELGVATGKRVPGGPESRRIHLLLLRGSALADQLRDRRHGSPFAPYYGATHASARERTRLGTFAIGLPPTEEPPLAGAVPGRSAAAVTRSRLCRCAK